MKKSYNERVAEILERQYQLAKACGETSKKEGDKEWAGYYSGLQLGLAQAKALLESEELVNKFERIFKEQDEKNQ